MRNILWVISYSKHWKLTLHLCVACRQKYCGEIRIYSSCFCYVLGAPGCPGDLSASLAMNHQGSPPVLRLEGRSNSVLFPFINPWPLLCVLHITCTYTAAVISTALPKNTTTPGRFIRFYTFPVRAKEMSWPRGSCYFDVWLGAGKSPAPGSRSAQRRLGRPRLPSSGESESAKGAQRGDQRCRGPWEHPPSSSKPQLTREKTNTMKKARNSQHLWSLGQAVQFTQEANAVRRGKEGCCLLL